MPLLVALIALLLLTVSTPAQVLGQAPAAPAKAACDSTTLGTPSFTVRRATVGSSGPRAHADSGSLIVRLSYAIEISKKRPQSIVMMFRGTAPLPPRTPPTYMAITDSVTATTRFDGIVPGGYRMMIRGLGYELVEELIDVRPGHADVVDVRSAGSRGMCLLREGHVSISGSPPR